MRHALVLLLLVACSTSPALSPRDCTPGATAACACPGASGVQTCGGDGTLGACVCADGGAGSDAGVAADVGTDARADALDAGSTPDVAADAAVADTQLEDRWVPTDVVCGLGQVVCGGGSALSPGRCVSLVGDPANCGACGMACQAPWPNSAPRCIPGGVCEFNCAPGWINCDGRIENGCELPLETTDCRTCGNNCPYPLTCALDGRCVPS